MKNTFGNSVSVTIFGESHGDMIGVVIDGLAPGITVDDDFIKEQLDQAGEEIREKYKPVRIREFESWDVLFHAMLDIPM